MKKIALLVFVLLVGCAQTPSRVASTPHEEPVATEFAPARAARAAEPSPVVPAQAVIANADDNAVTPGATTDDAAPHDAPADDATAHNATADRDATHPAAADGTAPHVAAPVSAVPVPAVRGELSGAREETAAAVPDAPPASLWARVIAGFRMPPMENDVVRQWEDWYSDRPEYVDRMIERTSRFLFFVVEQVEKRNMPLEIALLPMIESAYNPAAYSRAHASGMWQFVAATGRDYGLRQSWWYDGRRDVIDATEAALDYLEKLYGLFGDWQLALAAYNCGEGTVSRAIERNQAKGLPTDYESLSLPAETREYVPKLVAVKNIVSDPARYGLKIDDIENEQYFDVVTLKRHMDVKLAADLAEIPLQEFVLLNPGHTKPVIRAGEAEQIVLPKEAVEVFRRNLKHHRKPLVSWTAIRLRRTQSVQRIAAAHGMTLKELRSVNGLAAQRRVAAGQPILVRLTAAVANVTSTDASRPVSLPHAIRVAKAKARTGSSHEKRTRGSRTLPVANVRSSTRKRVQLSRRGAPRASHAATKREASRRR
jgi:membrane-bound lytic murein transglycosylase D